MTTEPYLTALEQSFSRRQWAARRVPDQLVYEATFEAHHTRVLVHAQAFPEINAITVVGYATNDIPASRCGLVAEMLMRLNHQLTLGNFELDYDTGRAVFRATNVFPSPEAAPPIVSALIHAAIAEIDRLTPLLTLLLRMSTEELARLNLKLFILREDLLPPVPEAP